MRAFVGPSRRYMLKRRSIGEARMWLMLNKDNSIDISRREFVDGQQQHLACPPRAPIALLLSTTHTVCFWLSSTVVKRALLRASPQPRTA